MTLREIIENPNRWGVLLKIVSATAISNNNSRNNKHMNQEGWDKLLNDYEEYLMDVDRLIKDAGKREGHKRSAFIRNLKSLETDASLDKKIRTLRGMGYKDFEIDALLKYNVLKNFFERESSRIEDGEAVVNDRINSLLKRFEAVQRYLLSISTEEDECRKK